MTGSTTPLIMLAIFLVGTLWLGMGYKNKKGNNGIVEYTIGNKTFTTAALVATILATGYGGGGLIRTVEMIYARGLWYILFMAIGMMIADSLPRIRYLTELVCLWKITSLQRAISLWLIL